MRKRAVVAGWLERTGALDVALRLRARLPSPWLTVLTYHSVRPSPGGFDEGVIDASPESLDRQLATVRRFCSPVSVDDVKAFVFDRRPLPRCPVLVTFDDGYRDNHDIALPLLLRHGIRATFFVATHYLTERRVFWWDRIAYLIRQSPRARAVLSYPAPIELDLSDRSRAIRQAQRIAKDTPGLDFARYLGELEQATKVGWTLEDERRFADQLILSWDQVRALRRAGMDVASHTRTHRVLHTLSPAHLEEELSGSRKELEHLLKEPVRTISYPVGKTIADRPTIRAAVKAAGYELGFSNASGVNNFWQRVDPLDLRRISLDLDLGDALFRGIVALPPLGQR